MTWEIETCPSCEGTGEGRTEWSRCWECRGSGSVEVEYPDSEEAEEE